MKGIILAGGSGTRLYPITQATSKQLLPIYDKPMIYYPLSTLMTAGIRDILLITTKEDQPRFKAILGDGKDFGINLEYIIQPSPDGLAQAFILGEKFIGDDECAMILGDNIFVGFDLKEKLEQAMELSKEGIATIFGYQVKDPERFGVMEIDDNNKVLSVEEKPAVPKSEYAITGLYFYPKDVAKYAKKVTPSKRGELEITDLNDIYLKQGKLNARLLGEGRTFWYDTGTFASMNEASNMVRMFETQGNCVISSPEKIAYDNNWISDDTLYERSEELKKNTYGEYLKKVLKRSKR